MRNISNSCFAAMAAMAACIAHADVNSNSSNGIFTFSGSGFDHSKDLVTLTCNQSFDFRFSGIGTNTLVTDATAGDATAGATLCGTVEFDGFDWPATATSANDLGTSPTDTKAVLLDFYNVEVTSFLGSCEGTVEDVVFANAVSSTDTRSYFYFNSEVGNDGCLLEGTVYSEDDVNVWGS